MLFSTSKRGDFAVEINFVFCIWCIRAFFSVLEWHLIKIDVGIQILQLKKDGTFLLFLLLFSECFHLYLRKPMTAKSLLWMCCITYIMQNVQWHCDVLTYYTRQMVDTHSLLSIAVLTSNLTMIWIDYIDYWRFVCSYTQCLLQQWYKLSYITSLNASKAQFGVLS